MEPSILGAFVAAIFLTVLVQLSIHAYRKHSKSKKGKAPDNKSEGEQRQEAQGKRVRKSVCEVNYNSETKAFSSRILQKSDTQIAGGNAIIGGIDAGNAQFTKDRNGVGDTDVASSAAFRQTQLKEEIFEDAVQGTDPIPVKLVSYWEAGNGGSHLLLPDDDWDMDDEDSDEEPEFVSPEEGGRADPADTDHHRITEEATPSDASNQTRSKVTQTQAEGDVTSDSDADDDIPEEIEAVDDSDGDADSELVPCDEGRGFRLSISESDVNYEDDWEQSEDSDVELKKPEY